MGTLHGCRKCHLSGSCQAKQHPAALNVHIYNSNFVLNSPAANLCGETVDSVPKINYPLNMLSSFPHTAKYYITH